MDIGLEEKRRIIDDFRAKVEKAGCGVQKGFQLFKLSHGKYYGYLKAIADADGVAQSTVMTRKKRTPRLVEVEALPAHPGSLVILMGTPKDVNEALSRLVQIRG